MASRHPRIAPANEPVAGSTESSSTPSATATDAVAAYTPYNLDHEKLLRELKPSSELERLAADEVAFSSHVLAQLKQKPIEAQDAHWVRQYTLMSRIRTNAMRDLERMAAASKKAREESAAKGLDDPPVIPPKPPQEVLDRAAQNWRDRIAYLPELDDEWPFLLEPLQRVEWYLSFLAEGYADEDLFRFDPRISWSDIAAMKACQAERCHGRFDGVLNRPKNMPIYEKNSLPDDLRAQIAERDRTLPLRVPWPDHFTWKGQKVEIPFPKLNFG